MRKQASTLPFLPYARQQITSDDVDAVRQALQSEIITRGPRVEEFEEALARYVGARYAVAFNSGSTALRAATFAAKAKPGDRLITTPNSFVATSVAGAIAGAVPVFLDIDPTTGNMDLTHLGLNLESTSTRGRNIVLPVHYAGIPVDMQQLSRVIRETDTVVIEDGAAALGSSYDGVHRVGSCEWSDMTVFSFHPAKLLTTGEGGLVTTNDAGFMHRLRAFRNNGIERDPVLLSDVPGPWYYEVLEMAGNYNFTDFQAALGLSQLNRISTLIAQKQQVISWYQKHLQGIPHVTLLTRLSEKTVSPHLAVLRIDFDACGKDRAHVMNGLRDKGIGTQVHYIPIYRHPIFSKASLSLIDYFPAMELFYKQALSLPLFSGLTEEDVIRVCQALKSQMSLQEK